jgi:hypothetical protein
MDYLSSQPRDILHCIIAYLIYTSDTARLGRTCKRLDRVPNWYERSGHLHPHETFFVFGTVSHYYVDGRMVEGIANDSYDDGTTQYCGSRTSQKIESWLDVKQGRLKRQYDPTVGESFKLKFDHTFTMTNLQFSKGNGEMNLQSSSTEVSVLFTEEEDEVTLRFDRHSQQIKAVVRRDIRTEMSVFYSYEHKAEGETTVESFVRDWTSPTVFTVDTTSLPTLFDYDMGIFHPHNSI